METAPDGIEPLIGYRWMVVEDDGSLRGPHVPLVWQPGVNEAMCLPALSPWLNKFTFGNHVHHQRGQPAPEPACRCGIYGYHSEVTAWSLRNHHPGKERHKVLVACKVWGEMEIYQDGFRAQYGELLAIWQPGWPRAAVHQAAERYQIPLAHSLSDLRKIAQPHGTSPTPQQLHDWLQGQPQPDMLGTGLAIRSLIVQIYAWTLGICMAIIVQSLVLYPVSDAIYILLALLLIPVVLEGCYLLVYRRRLRHQRQQ